MVGRPRSGGWWIVGEPELHYDENIAVPDLAGWRRERMPVYPRGPFVELAPDWICEVLSPRTARLDWEEKLPLYGRMGCSSAWVLVPEAQRLEVLRHADGSWTRVGLFRGDDIVRAEPFPDVALRLETVWDPAE
jgi:Uma2 family endonuclease